MCGRVSAVYRHAPAPPRAWIVNAFTWGVPCPSNTALRFIPNLHWILTSKRYTIIYTVTNCIIFYIYKYVNVFLKKKKRARIFHFAIRFFFFPWFHSPGHYFAIRFLSIPIRSSSSWIIYVFFSSIIRSIPTFPFHLLVRDNNKESSLLRSNEGS